MAFTQLQQIQDLRIGLYVKLEGSWFCHPFPTNTFKIKSDNDLKIIKNLKKVQIFYDPDRSDLSSSQDVESEQPTLDQAHRPEDQDLLQENEPQPEVLRERETERPEVIVSGRDNEETHHSDNTDPGQDARKLCDHLKKVEVSYHKALGQSGEFLQQIYNGQRKGVKTAEMIVANLQRILENPRAAMALVDVVGGNGVEWGLSEHALNVCVLSLVIGRQMNQTPDELLNLGIGALFHDIGYRFLPMKVRFLSVGMKVQADTDMLHHHPERGGQLMESFPGMSPSVLEIIGQHHERLDGSGFPEGLRKEDLSDLTKIVMVADYFDELCNAPNPESSLTPHAALSFFYRHVVNMRESTKFCERVVESLLQGIGIYPPGSIVELSDGSLGIVSSLNFESPARPIVTLYAPGAGPTDKKVVDLVQEVNLSVKQALHPKNVDPPVLAYLCPRRMAIFVHTSDKTSVVDKVNKKVLAGPQAQ